MLFASPRELGACTRKGSQGEVQVRQEKSHQKRERKKTWVNRNQGSRMKQIKARGERNWFGNRIEPRTGKRYRLGKEATARKTGGEGQKVPQETTLVPSHAQNPPPQRGPRPDRLRRDQPASGSFGYKPNKGAEERSPASFHLRRETTDRPRDTVKKAENRPEEGSGSGGGKTGGGLLNLLNGEILGAS